MSGLIIRREEIKEYREVEELTRNAFWNVYEPGCTEHYLLHVMRSHPDFIPELDLVAEVDGKIAGSIVYTKSGLEDEEGNKKNILSFGPIAIAPEFQRRGIGKKLQEASFQKALELGYDCVVIFGNPGNYVTSGFKSCKKYNVSIHDKYPTALLVKELIPGALDNRKWIFCESEAGNIDARAAEEFDKTFEPKEKKYQPSQEEFYIYCHSSIG